MASLWWVDRGWKEGLEEKGAVASVSLLKLVPNLSLEYAFPKCLPIALSISFSPSPTEPGKVLFALCSVPRATGQAAGVCVEQGHLRSGVAGDELCLNIKEVNH